VSDGRDTTDGQPPADNLWDAAAPKPIDPETGQHGAYWVLPESDRKRGFIRPYRDTYIHNKCGTKTTMGTKISETYAADPGFYSSTFCVGCRTHFPVREFKWKDGSELGS
jgi:hypothetical protein